MRLLNVLVWVVVGGSMAPTWLEAQKLPPAPPPGPAAVGKLGSVLDEMTRLPAGSTAVLRELAARHHAAFASGRIDVEIVLDRSAVWDAADFRTRYGVQTIYHGVDRQGGAEVPYVWARVPLARLSALAAENSAIVSISPAAAGVVQAATEGPDLVGAKANYHNSGHKGRGVKVAVVDLGFAGWTDLQQRGTLPADVVAVDFTGLGMELEGDSRQPHGAAVAEIVTSMAPEASLYLLHVSSSVSLQEAVQYCIDNGIQIINHSVAWFNTSFYDGQGPISDIAARARDAGILWVNSAGNFARAHYQGQYSSPDSDAWHNFVAGDETINVQLQAGRQVRLYLTWNAWGNVDGEYRLHLFDSRLDKPLASSAASDVNRKTPTAVLTYTAVESGTYHIAIQRTRGTRAHLLELFASPLVFDEHAVSAFSLPDPGPSERVLAVGAVARDDWDNGPVEDYSSHGPVSGGAMKPDLCGPDGVTTDTYSIFNGTSASSPQVAGAAALLWSRYPESSVDDIRLLLEANARPFDNATRTNACGAGFLDLPWDTRRPAVEISRDVRILEPGPYYPGQPVTGVFTLHNTGTGCIYFRTLVLGGRTPEGNVVDFPRHNNVVLCPGSPYSYSAVLRLPATSELHLFVAARTADGGWTSPGAAADIASVAHLTLSTAGTVMWGIDASLGGASARLLRLNPVTGAAVLVGSTGVDELTDLAETPDGSLYAVNSTRLLRLNPLTGAAVDLGGLGFVGINGLTSDANGMLYAGTVYGELLFIDPVTVRAELVGHFGSGISMSGDLVFAPDGTLFGTARGTTTDYLVRIDRISGAATFVGAIGYPGVYGLAFDDSAALLAVAQGNSSTSRLLRLNPANGAGTLIGNLSTSTGLNGLATGRAPSAWTPFQDDVEGDTSAWLAQAPWTVSAEDAHSPAYAWNDSPLASYANRTNSSIFSPMFSLANLTGATLSFWHRFDTEFGYDFCQVWITTDFGATYYRLASFTGGSNGWVRSTVDLSRYLGSANVFIAFQLVSDGSNVGNGWGIDDISVTAAR